MKIKTLKEAVDMAIKMGFGDVTIMKYSVTCARGGWSRDFVNIHDADQINPIYYENAELDLDHEGDIQFNEMSFDEWKAELGEVDSVPHQEQQLGMADECIINPDWDNPVDMESINIH